MKKTLYIILAGALLATSCDNELDRLNPNAPTTELFWQNATDAQQGVNAIYSTLHRGAISRWQWFYFTIRSDEGFSVSPATDIINNMDRFLVTDLNYGNMVGVYSDNYIGIFRANQVLDNVPNIDMDPALKQRLIGEAKFLRGLYYFNLASLWGNVPLLLQTSQPSDLPPTSPREQVWAQIEQDLTDAAAALPVSYTGNDIGRATKGAANALLAKTYMQAGDYSAALEPLEWLVKGEGSTVYDLIPDYRDNFLKSTENNPESVFEWQFAENPSEFTDNDVQTPNQNYGTSLPQFLSPANVGFSDGEAFRWLVKEFEEEKTANGERDPRLAASFIFDSTDVRGPEFTMVYGRTFKERYGTDNRRVWFRKFLSDTDPGRTGEGFRSANNYRYIRYSEVLLLYAEALNAVGRTEEAYPYVDRVRERVGLAPLSDVKPGLNQQQFLEQLKHERITELAGEGHRWNDLDRWGYFTDQQKINELIQRDPAFANFKVGRDEFLPIPQRDVDINPNLSQNPNW
ncbi:RagB/SusD family nutrient uptake outer membrane protein [Pontibacter chitinilyticus]|uniref:RagB/SusD family nutrient uptake outer membrane protein n=1 Tax=Pontibacter chitinilyticus TaxID=2674989 RepID=UPI00321BDAB5